MKIEATVDVCEIYDSLRPDNQLELLNYIYDDMRISEQIDWITDKIRYGNEELIEEIKQLITNNNL